MRHVLRLACLILGLSACLGVSPALAFDANGGITAPSAVVGGMTYGDWSAAWWQYMVAIPATTNPLNDASGCGPLQATGPVIFLAGSFVGPVTRSCTVPANKAILLPIINTECSTLEGDGFHGDNAAELRACASLYGDAIGVRTLKASIDGTPIPALGAFRAQSPVYNFRLPSDNVLGASVGDGLSVSDGYWLLLNPLPHGHHVIRVFGACLPGSPCDGFYQDVTFRLTVPK